MLSILLNEDLWFPAAVTLGLIATAGFVSLKRTALPAMSTRVLCGLNLFYGVLIGIMGFGHLLAVTIKVAQGTLPETTNLWFVYPFGIGLAFPAWWLVATVVGLTQGERTARTRAIGLNVWLGLALIVPGGPLAAPALLNVAMLARR